MRYPINTIIKEINNLNKIIFRTSLLLLSAKTKFLALAEKIWVKKLVTDKIIAYWTDKFL